MSYDVPIKNSIVIPEYELEITTSRAGGPGGQHVNKANTRITVRWNVKSTKALTAEQKEYAMHNLRNRLTTEGDLVIHNNETRSQQQNRKLALGRLAQLVRKALYVPKKRMKTHISKAVKESRLEQKSRHGELKKMRSEKLLEE